MFILKKLLSALILPPFGLFLVLALGLYLLARPRRRWLGRTLVAGTLAALMLLSVPLVANTLLRTVETEAPITAAALARAQAIVVLGGGSYQSAPEYGGAAVSGPSTLERLRYAANLQRSSGLPLLVTGGAPFGGVAEGTTMAQSLRQDFGVPVRWVETASRDTAENASMSAVMLRAAGITRIALVSHAWHLPRAIELFERQGLTVIPAPTVFVSKPSATLENLLPSVDALTKSYIVTHEWLGRLVQALHS